VESVATLRRALFAIAFGAASFVSARPAKAAGFRLFQSTAVLERPFAPAASQEFTLGACCQWILFDDPVPRDSFRLDFQFPGPIVDLAPPPKEPVPAPFRFEPVAVRPKYIGIGVVSAGAIAGSYLNASTDGPRHDFHFTNEGYFGRNTYVGGGDKASHFVSYYSVARLMTSVYEAFDLAEDSSYELASATSFAAGLATELGDGTNKYGFSHEDLVIDTAGAATAFVLARYRLNDLIGFRAGIVPAPDTPDPYEGTGTGKDYSKEIYTADLKLAGLSRRIDRRFGPARFLLISMTYGVKGYPYAVASLRERQVGLEVGLNVAEIARAVGVPQNRWWGRIALTILDVIRIPYTAVGIRYDINHKKWIGPDTGQTFSFP